MCGTGRSVYAEASLVYLMRSVPELALPREDHGEPEFVCRGDDRIVANGPAWLNHHPYTGFCCGLDAIGERVKGVGSGRPILRPTICFGRGDLTGFNAVLLPGTDAPGRPVLRRWPR